MARKQEQRSQQVVRIFNHDIDGSKHILYGLTNIYGVSLSVANGPV